MSPVLSGSRRRSSETTIRRCGFRVRGIKIVCEHYSFQLPVFRKYRSPSGRASDAQPQVVLELDLNSKHCVCDRCFAGSVGGAVAIELGTTVATITISACQFLGNIAQNNRMPVSGASVPSWIYASTPLIIILFSTYSKKNCLNTRAVTTI